jgi:hypothetical protein
MKTPEQIVQEIKTAGLIESLTASLSGLQDFVNPFFMIPRLRLKKLYGTDEPKELLQKHLLPQINAKDITKYFSPAELNLFYGMWPKHYCQSDSDVKPFNPKWREK